MAPRSKLPTRRRVLDSLLRLEDRSVPAAAFLLTDNALLAFDTSNPAAAGAPLAITGVEATDTLVGIDVRPVNGVLYGLGVDAANDAATLYAIDTRTGAAVAVGAPGAVSLTQANGTDPVDLPAPGAGTGYGFDFNPAADRVRVVTTTGLNFRINPNTGEAVDADGNDANGSQPDAALNGDAAAASAAAYTNNSATAGVTTLYVLDPATDRLLIQRPPNDGTLVEQFGVTLGGSKLDFTEVNGFDIPAGVDAAANDDPATGSAFAALTVGTPGVTGLYQIDLGTGAATLVGPVGDGSAAAR
ncbi:MAG: DUF4394 domain-containing protein, partial [Gemmataceae bacterium]|nr:DUF4394 domain-containing protein [Gemmataceae bacterium]